MEASRIIMWNIPSSFKVAMYLLFALSLVILFKGLWTKLKFVAGDKKISDVFSKKGLLPQKLNWQAFFQTIFFTGKVPRKPSVAIFHSLIYYGFIILWIATDLVAIHYDTPFKIFQGTTYIVISFLADLAGIAILIGLSLAYWRRYIKRPASLSATHPKSEFLMYLQLANLVIVGYLIEGIRILGTQMPLGEKTWSPVGWALASSFGTLAMSDETLAIIFRSLWAFHMLSTMVFIASFGYSKFSHVLLLPFSALITPKRRGAVILPMDFENEEAETFGLGKLSELTMKNRFDTLACVECGRCSDVCPAKGAGKPLDPKTIITKARDFSFSQLSQGQVDGEIWGENPIYQANELDSCTTCGACMEECPANIEHVSVIMELKRYKVLTKGEIPAAAGDAVQKIKNNGNPWGIAQHDRFNWAQGLDIPVIEKGKKVDYLYYVGCAGSYDGANQKVVKDTIGLLKRANVSFAVLGKEEKCNGDPIRRFGDEYSFYEVAIENIATLKNYEFDKIVTHCPHCLHTIGKEYGKFEDGQFETIHHTELLNELLKEGKLTPTKSLNQETTFHDPCYLGRHHGSYSAPRDILSAIPGLKFVEMKRSKDKALCCGMGGGNMWYELEEGEHLANNRLKDIGETKAGSLATGCSFCMINFNSAKGHQKATENLEVEDVASLLAKSIE